MNTISFVRVAAIIGLAGILSGCHFGTGLDTDAAASLITAKWFNECATGYSQLSQDIDTSGEGQPGVRLADKIIALINGLSHDQNAQLVSVSEDPFHISTFRNFLYNDDGHPILIYTNEGSVTPGCCANVQIRACAYVPASVNILDITVDETGKQAKVTYTLNLRVSRVGTLLVNAGLGPLKPPLQDEFHANLQRLDATGWRYGSDD